VPETARVIVVDDDPVFRQALIALFADSEGIEVVGEASDGEAAVELAEALEPHLMVMDVGMPRLGGLDATGRIQSHDPTIAVVVVSGVEQTDGESMALQAGAVAYLRKSSDLLALVPLVQGLAREAVGARHRPAPG
jgi:DNA-binding NarL/FixJ family response regulator